jgi:hypothetical protein
MLFALCDESSVELEGNNAELRNLSHEIKACTDVCEMPLSAPAERDERGLIYLTRLLIKVTSGPVIISVSERELSVSGARDKLDLLCENVDWLIDPNNSAIAEQTRDHLHLEFYPGHFFLSADALPMVLVRQD